ncbi:MAG: bifunctional DNA primase/polymerase, partial [Verrucomicrobiota bacterium]
MTLLGHVLQYHQRGLNLLPIAAGTKKPTCEYKHWLSTRQTEQDIRKLFVGDVGVGVILGAVSGNLYVRDFDKLSAYDQWSTTHPQL